MSEVNNFDRASGPDAGAHGSFLEECGVFVSPRSSGAQKRAEIQNRDADVRDCAPVRTQDHREHRIAVNRGGSEVRSPSDAEGNEKNFAGDDWAASADRLIKCFPCPDLRSDLVDFYNETAAALEHMQGNARERAEMLAFGHLMFKLLRDGVDIPVIPNPQKLASTD